MCRIPYNRIIFQQWTNISYESFTNKIEPSRIEPSEKDADTLKSFSYYSTDVKFERQIRVNYGMHAFKMKIQLGVPRSAVRPGM